MKKNVKISACLKPAPNILVSCKDKSGNMNALAVAYCCNCSYDPPMLMVGIVPSRHSYNMIKESGCFVVNLVAKDYKKQFDYLGSVSGKDENKIEKMSINITKGNAVDAPLLADCPVNIECSIVDSIMTGSHEMFVGKIEHISADELFVDQEGKIDFDKIDLL